MRPVLITALLAGALLTSFGGRARAAPPTDLHTVCEMSIESGWTPTFGKMTSKFRYATSLACDTIASFMRVMPVRPTIFELKACVERYLNSPVVLSMPDAQAMSVVGLCVVDLMNVAWELNYRSGSVR